MIKNIFETSTIRLLEKGLDLSSLRHRAISENIANSETPGYKKKEVPFYQLLKDTVSGYSGDAMAKKVPTVNEQEKMTREINTVSMKNDGNNVDIDEEMVKLAQNTLYYQTLSQQINAYFMQLRTVINGRR